jgi:hypothetical protein
VTEATPHDEDLHCRARLGSSCRDVGLRQGRAAEAKAGVEKAIADMGCTMDADDDIEAGKGGSYKADDVQCKDGQFDMTFDKDFKVTNKKKED